MAWPYVPNIPWVHYCDVIIGAMASLITSLTIVYSIVHSGADQRKQSSTSLAGHRWFRAEMASNAENVSIWWRHNVIETHSCGKVLINIMFSYEHLDTSAMPHNRSYGKLMLGMQGCVRGVYELTWTLTSAGWYTCTLQHYRCIKINQCQFGMALILNAPIDLVMSYLLNISARDLQNT